MKVVRRQQSSEVRAGNALRTYDDGTKAAIILVRAGDVASLMALTRVFQDHRAPTVDLEHAVPDLDGTVGDCVLRDDGVLIMMKGVDHHLLGVTMDLSWTGTPTWRKAASEEGCVWAGLLSEEAYQQAFPGDAVPLYGPQAPRIPPLPVLKLEVVQTAG